VQWDILKYLSTLIISINHFTVFQTIQVDIEAPVEASFLNHYHIATELYFI